MKLVFILIIAASFSQPINAWPGDKVHVSHSAISGSQAILWVAEDAGFFKKYDLDPQVVFVSGAPPNIAALVSGDLDFPVFAGPASVAANLEGADTVVLMSFINIPWSTPSSRDQISRNRST